MTRRILILMLITPACHLPAGLGELRELQKALTAELGEPNVGINLHNDTHILR